MKYSKADDATATFMTIVTVAEKRAADLLLMDFVAGDSLQSSHVGPGHLPAFLSQVFKRRVLTQRD